MKATRLVLVLLVQMASSFVFSQKQNLKFNHLDISDGLSQNNVMCLMEGSRGFMWFGTRDGLNKYDGYKFTVYKNDAKDSNSISNNFITGIVEDASGRSTWITTRGGGLNHYDKEKDRFIHYKNNPKDPNSISSDLLSSLNRDSEGNLWICTEKGLDYF